jgi:hypothetical protein
MEAEHRLEAAHEALRKARDAIPLGEEDTRSWESH